MKRADLVEAAHNAIAAGSKSFRFASQIFDKRTRERSWLLYAWCRACDDITDGQVLGHGAVAPANPAERIAFLTAETDRALAGEASAFVPFEAFRLVAAECGIAPADAHDHLAGFARDAAGWRPETEEDLLSYCYQVAGAVGVMMAKVMGVAPGDEDTLDRAADLGLAFQLANIARDVVEDARVGRIYLPRQWLRDAGLAGADLSDPRHRDALAPLAARLADLAERFRASSTVGAARLPFRSRWAVLSAAHIYGAVARRAKALGPAAWDKRIHVSKAAKLGHVAAACLAALSRPSPVSREGLWTRPRHAARAAAPRGSRKAAPSAPRPAARRRSRS